MIQDHVHAYYEIDNVLVWIFSVMYFFENIQYYLNNTNVCNGVNSTFVLFFETVPFGFNFYHL